MARYIDAEKFLDYLDISSFGTQMEKWWPQSRVVEKIDAIPTEDVAPVVHAHWIKYSGGMWECSNCGAYITGEIDEAFPQHYCRGCGAKMDKENENGEIH